jgi:predicted Zn finger-like uncharacterized protein
MYVECPQCEALFRITSQDLTRADGLVRCGQCLEVFNGLDRLRALQPDDEPEAFDGTRHEHEHEHEHDRTQFELTSPEEVVLAETPAPSPEDESDPGAQLESEVLSDPGLAATDGGRQRRGGLIWGALNLLLILALGLQYVHAERRELYRYPELQPWLERMCALASCELPPRRDASRIELLNRNVYSHPNREGALMITATLVNTAPHPQPFPLVELTLSDLQGQIVALRRFRPAEYLSAQETAQNPMEPGVPAALKLEIRDPGSHALAFEFDFL